MQSIKALHARRFGWDFHDSPIYWANGSPALSHLLNVYTLLVPDNEKYYIRALSSCRAMLTSPSVQAQLLEFCRQESLHGLAHQRHWYSLRSRGLAIDKYIRAVNWFLYSFLEKASPLRLRVSVVAAIEHVNASWAHAFLELDLLENSDKDLRDLFYWHFAEEIEHKAVAHNVLSEAYPGYFTRCLGAAIAFPLFLGLIVIGVGYFLAATPRPRWYSIRRDSQEQVISTGLLRLITHEMLRYFRSDFDPWGTNDYDLAHNALGSITKRRKSLLTSAIGERIVERPSYKANTN